MPLQERLPWDGGVQDISALNSRSCSARRQCFSTPQRDPREKYRASTPTLFKEKENLSSSTVQMPVCCPHCGGEVPVPMHGAANQCDPGVCSNAQRRGRKVFHTPRKSSSKCESDQTTSTGDQDVPDGLSTQERQRAAEIMSSLARGLMSPTTVRRLRQELERLKAVGEQRLKDSGAESGKKAASGDALASSQKGKGKGKQPPPPPPPSMPRKSSPENFARTPSVVHFGRRINWRMLGADKIAGTIFAELEVRRCVDIDCLVALFPKESGRTRAIGARTTLPSSKIEILDLKRARNAEIIMRCWPLDEIGMHSLKTMDISSNALCKDACTALANVAPTAEEAQKLRQFSGALSTLRSVERQLLPLAAMHSPSAVQRLNLFKLGLELPETVHGAREHIELMKKAIMAVRSSTAFRAALRHLRCLGNVINHGFGAATKHVVEAFSLDIMPKLLECKSPTNYAITMLHVLVAQLLAEDETWPTALLGEIGCVLEAVQFSLPQLAEEVRTVQSAAQQFEAGAAEALKATQTPDNLSRADTAAPTAAATLAERAAAAADAIDAAAAAAAAASAATRTAAASATAVETAASTDAASSAPGQVRDPTSALPEVPIFPGLPPSGLPDGLPPRLQADIDVAAEEIDATKDCTGHVATAARLSSLAESTRSDSALLECRLQWVHTEIRSTLAFFGQGVIAEDAAAVELVGKQCAALLCHVADFLRGVRRCHEDLLNTPELLAACHRGATLSATRGEYEESHPQQTKMSL